MHASRAPHGRLPSAVSPGAGPSRVRSVSAALLLCLLAALGGCTNYRASEEGRTAGEVTDDTAIHLRVKAGLIAGRDLPGWRIDVDVREGIVVLTGIVDSEEQRARAIGVVRGVPGVKDVEDRLVVDGASPAEASPEDPAP